VEKAFRADEVDCLVATSAFGEGVNLPNIRDAVLYHLPYSLIDFNQMAGRAGRDGQESRVHVLAQEQDLVWMRAKLRGEEGEGEGEGDAQGSDMSVVSGLMTPPARVADPAVPSHAMPPARVADPTAASPESQAEDSVSLALLDLFADWFFTASAHELSSTIQRPLTPKDA
jgi:hypothetical protein